MYYLDVFPKEEQWRNRTDHAQGRDPTTLVHEWHFCLQARFPTAPCPSKPTHLQFHFISSFPCQVSLRGNNCCLFSFLRSLCSVLTLFEYQEGQHWKHRIRQTLFIYLEEACLQPSDTDCCGWYCSDSLKHWPVSLWSKQFGKLKSCFPYFSVIKIPPHFRWILNILPSLKKKKKSFSASRCSYISLDLCK